MFFKIAPLLALSIATASAAPCTAPPPAPGTRIAGEVTAVVTGDTFCLAEPTGGLNVRLADFAACSPKTRRGAAARLDLTKIIGGKRVVCTVTRRTGLRVIARCTVEGHSVAKLLRYAGTCERR